MNALPTSSPGPAAAAAGAMPDFLAPVFAQYPLPVVDAEGVWLHTRDGLEQMYGRLAAAATVRLWD